MSLIRRTWCNLRRTLIGPRDGRSISCLKRLIRRAGWRVEHVQGERVFFRVPGPDGPLLAGLMPNGRQAFTFCVMGRVQVYARLSAEMESLLTSCTEDRRHPFVFSLIADEGCQRHVVTWTAFPGRVTPQQMQRIAIELARSAARNDQFALDMYELEAKHESGSSDAKSRRRSRGTAIDRLPKNRNPQPPEDRT